MTQNTTTASASKNKGIDKEPIDRMPLVRRNFIMMTIAGAMIVIGFILMLGDSSTIDSFNPDIFSTRRIVIGPLITFIGFIFMGFAIILRPAAGQNNKKIA